ncbi:alpha/beta fold hydrolase [Saccharopolyspora sp. TS4A08]|uniref:Alpha/beta fold hydrolase n=1 Tax=Saccharopolyspora ipomoeae TaxID=3042027 RepID=A0ABT6PLF9_9PSEU|nr:alpha/beta fold hydrolase [Saccharopolyspora sp. TS4A08]MDI2028680.1 alpha/beta fold hydrolase [Saccharopolyspora sp. TS4A08]
MHYIESGAGTPVVLLHAFPVDARMWDPLRGRLEEQVRIIAPDQRGLGESALDGLSARGMVDERSASLIVDRPGIDVAAADVVELLDRLELPRVVLGGCSMGGYVASAVLRAAPQRVAGLLLVDTKAPADTEGQRANRLNVAARAEQEGISGWLAESMLPNLLGASTRQRRPEVVEELRALIEAQPADGVAWAQRAMASRPDSLAALRGFDGPAMVVVGSEDTITPPEAAREMVDALPNGELVELSGVGHLPSLEAPDALAQVLLPWLASIDV